MAQAKTRAVQSWCEAAGAALVATGFFMIWVPLGFLFIGAALVLVGNMKAGK